MTSAKIGRPIDILMVEDNPGDARLAYEALKEAKVLNEVHVVEDGLEALAFLRRQGKYANAVRPELILLDLNLPKKDGREVLAEIKEGVLSLVVLEHLVANPQFLNHRLIQEK